MNKNQIREDTFRHIIHRFTIVLQYIEREQIKSDIMFFRVH
jgi:hypothetical protein